MISIFIGFNDSIMTLKTIVIKLMIRSFIKIKQYILDIESWIHIFYLLTDYYINKVATVNKNID